jgi:hypothetical protein
MATLITKAAKTSNPGRFISSDKYKTIFKRWLQYTLLGMSVSHQMIYETHVEIGTVADNCDTFIYLFQVTGFVCVFAVLPHDSLHVVGAKSVCRMKLKRLMKIVGTEHTVQPLCRSKSVGTAH